MGDFDPVSWDTRDAALGPFAGEIEERVRRMEAAVRDEDPYGAVKAIHDALSADLEAGERTTPDLGEVFVTAYLLERRGIIAPDGETAYRSLVERRPGRERLEELFWGRKRTLWWIGIVVGAHPSLVTYWLREADIPLMERNYTAEAMERIRTHRAADGT